MKQWIQVGFVLLVGAFLLSGCKTPLHKAAQSGNTAEVQRLLDSGADVNERSYCRWTPLMMAAGNGRTDCVRLLLDRGADVNAEQDTWWTALEMAVYHGHVDCVNALLEKDAALARSLEFTDDPVIENLLKDAPQKQKAKRIHAETVVLTRQLSIMTLAQLLEQAGFSNEAFVLALTDKLIEAKNRELPALIMQSTVDQRVVLLTTVEKRLVQAQAQIARCNSDAESYIRQGRESDASSSRSLAVALQAYVSVMKEFQSMLMQS